MSKPAIVRFKGAPWEALADQAETDRVPAIQSAPSKGRKTKRRRISGKAKAILLDLAIRHFRGLQLTGEEAARLAGALKRSLKGEAVDVGPVGWAGRTYTFRRAANAISIRVGEGRMRLPLDAARALIQPLKGAVSPRVFAQAS